MSINFISFNDSDETRNLRTKSDNIEIVMGDETYQIIDEFFESFSQNDQKDLKESLRGSEFIFDSVDLLYYNLQKTSLNRKGSSYIDCKKLKNQWVKNKEATVNPKIVFNDHDYSYVEMPNEHNKTLKYNHGEKSMKAPFIIYAGLVCLLEKMDSCRNNPEKSYTEKKN